MFSLDYYGVAGIDWRHLKVPFLYQQTYHYKIFAGLIN